MKKPLIGADLILSLGFIAYLYFDIKSDGDGSFLKGLKEMTSDVVFWYIVLALIIFVPIAILYAKKLEKSKRYHFFGLQLGRQNDTKIIKNRC